VESDDLLGGAIAAAELGDGVGEAAGLAPCSRVCSQLRKCRRDVGGWGVSGDGPSDSCGRDALGVVVLIASLRNAMEGNARAKFALWDDLGVDGVHDMGGTHGFGRVPIEVDEPLFHEPWEGRVWAMWAAISATTIDRFRFTIEQMAPAAYLASSYYERWLWAIECLAAEQGLLTSSDRPPAGTRPSPVLAAWPGRFQPGDSARVRNAITEGHTRVPRYLRLQTGRVERVACVWPNPGDSAATGTYGDPELVYTVAFNGEDLFGPGADHTLSADLPESDLENP